MGYLPPDSPKRPFDMDNVLPGDAVRWNEQIEVGGNWFNFCGYAELFPGGGTEMAILFGHSPIGGLSNLYFYIPKQQFLKQFTRV